MSGCGLRPVRHLGFDLADRFVERQTLAHDLRFRERRCKTAELNHQGPPRVLVNRSTPGLVGVPVKAGDGAGDELIVIDHGRLEMSDTQFWRLIALDPLGTTLRASASNKRIAATGFRTCGRAGSGALPRQNVP